MSVRSMTGFARVRKTTPQGEIVVSLKSVNHRGLDLHFHLPPELDPIETDVRNIVKNACARGHIQLQVDWTGMGGGSAGLNRPLLAAWMAAFREALELYPLADQQPDLNAALRTPGMLGGEEERREAGEEIVQAVMEGLQEALAMLNEFREREGAAMAAEMRQRSATLFELTARIERIRAGAQPTFQKRLRDKLADLLAGTAIDSQRLSQEAAIIADRSDVAEELVRLKTHAAQLNTILEGTGEVGKRLDFLLQEMNREANTILSKTGGLGDLGLTITDLALAAKSEIDKIREQSLNLE
jgi:uncharacterized protein (TIGR00255 family)